MSSLEISSILDRSGATRRGTRSGWISVAGWCCRWRALMFFPEGQIRVHLYRQPCDMGKSFDGLQALVRHGPRADPTNGGLYAFVNRRASQMRVLYFDRSGFCIWAKRLEGGPLYQRLVSGAHAGDGLHGPEDPARGDRAGARAQALSTADRGAKICSK